MDRTPRLGNRAAHVQQIVSDMLVKHRRYIERYGEDLPEIRDWRWRSA